MVGLNINLPHTICPKYPRSLRKMNFIHGKKCSEVVYAIHVGYVIEAKRAIYTANEFFCI